MEISQRHQEHIKHKVESGRYGSPDEVIARALALLDERDEELERELADMREKVRIGTEQADAGRLKPASEVFDRLLKRNAERTT